MDYPSFLRALLSDRGWTQARLADETGIDQAMISQYVNGKAMPAGLACLLLAGVSANENQRRYWRSLGIGESQLRLVARAVSDVAIDLRSLAPEQAELVMDVVAFLSSEDPTKHAVRVIVDDWKARQGKGKRRGAPRATGT